MELKYRYFTDYDEKLANQLKKSNIQYKHINRNSSDIKMQALSFYLDKNQKKELSKGFVAVLFPFEKEYTYSEEEIEKSEYLKLICENPGVEITNENQACKYKCRHKGLFGKEKSHNRQQEKPFVVKCEPVSKNKHLFVDILDQGYLFCDNGLIELLQSNGITGIDYWKVFINNKESKRIFQLRGTDCIGGCDLTYMNKKERRCKYCGEKELSYRYYGEPLIVSRKLTEDFYETERVFGGYNDPATYIVSSKMYHLLKDNKQARGCSFIPVMIQKRNSII